MPFTSAVHSKAIELAKLTLDMTAESGSGHPTSSMSLAQIVTVLMYDAMRWDPANPEDVRNDRLVLSEGHAVPIIYAAYADLGGVYGQDDERRPLMVSDLKTLRAVDSELDGHPNPMEGFPFFDAATGSLGQGLSVAAGLACAARLDGLDKRIYCLIGDGEAREGQIAEALDFIAEHKLSNVLAIINCNGIGQSDRVSVQQSPESMAAKLEAYGFAVRTIDGHDPDAVKKAVDEFAKLGDGKQPMAIVARTVKGWGAPSLQVGNWHGKPASGDALKLALAELDERRAQLVQSFSTGTSFFKVKAPTGEVPERPASDDTASFNESMAKYDMTSVVQKGSWATRRAYGVALRALGHTNDEVVVLDADVKNSTFAETFSKDSALANRFFECRIAEQNMYSVGAGLSAGGKVPFCSTFAKFVVRGYDQIEMAINSGANLKIVGSHSGVTLAADGPSQMGLPDVSFFRSFSKVRNHRGEPGCYILQPSDAYSAYALTLAMAEYEGVCYLRTIRGDTEFLYDDSSVFNLGGFEVLTKGRDLLIAASGYMVHEANKCLDALDKAGIDATLVDLYSLPFDTDKFLDLANENNGMILTIEDNYGGGIGSEVADALTEDGGAFTLRQMYVRRIPKSARSTEAELRYCGLHHTDIIETAYSMLDVAAVS